MALVLASDAGRDIVFNSRLIIIMGKFDILTYNRLPTISEAATCFENQITSSGVTREQIFSKLAALFVEGPHTGHYTVCLLHRHYKLSAGERMVTNGYSAKPSTDTIANIVADRWSSDGEEIEHRMVEDPFTVPPPPPRHLLAKFERIVHAHGITVLGICHAPTSNDLSPGFVFWESAGDKDREQVLKIVLESSLPVLNTYRTSWVPAFDAEDQSCTMICTHSCFNCPH